MKPKAQQRKHLKERLFQRFGIHVSKKQAQKDLKKMLCDRDSIYISKGTKGTTKHMVLYKNNLMVICYNRKAQTISTAWPVCIKSVMRQDQREGERV